MSVSPRAKILHVGNVVLNAYTSALTLNRAGYDCDVIADDFYHFASAPESYEIAKSRELLEISSQYFADFYMLGPDYPEIPRFVAHGPLFFCLQYLRARRAGAPEEETLYCALEYLKFKCIKLQTTAPFAAFWSERAFTEALYAAPLPQAVRRRIEAGRLVERLLFLMQAWHPLLPAAGRRPGFAPPMSAEFLDGFAPENTALHRWMADLSEAGTLQTFGIEHATGFAPPLHRANEDEAVYRERLNGLAGYWRDLCSRYDHCIFYGDSCVYPYLAGIEDYSALEFGTIRRLPFEDSPRGRLLREACLSAKRVFITNADYIAAEERLEFTADQAVYFPHPFHEQAARRHRAGFTGFPDGTGPVVFLCPSRQDWVSGDPQFSKGNDRYFRAAARLVAEGETGFELHCIDWGADLDASKALIAELGIADRVRWLAPLSKRQLWDAKLGANAVVDQFLLPAFGGVTFEALGLGCRVITSDDGSCNATFYGAAPPLLAAETVDEIAARLRQVIADPLDTAEIGKASIDWIAQYHSEARNLQILEQALGLPPSAPKPHVS